MTQQINYGPANPVAAKAEVLRVGGSQGANAETIKGVEAKPPATKAQIAQPGEPGYQPYKPDLTLGIGVPYHRTPKPA